MRYLSCVLFVFLAGCAGYPDDKPTGAKSYLGSQLHLIKLRDSLRAEFDKASSLSEKSGLLEKYHHQLNNFLMENRIDSFHVTVDEVIKNGWQITTRFHFEDIEFKYGLTFKEDLPARMDSVYKFMLGLKPGMDTTVSFSYTGACRVNDPTDKTTSTFRIFAFPIPLEFSK